MIAEAVEQLIAHEAALIAALDGQRLEPLECAVRGVQESVARVADLAGWRLRPDLRGRLLHAAGLADAAAGRIHYLADRNHRRLERLAALTGAPLPGAYGRAGRAR